MRLHKWTSFQAPPGWLQEVEEGQDAGKHPVCAPRTLAAQDVAPSLIIQSPPTGYATVGATALTSWLLRAQCAS